MKHMAVEFVPNFDQKNVHWNIAQGLLNDVNDNPDLLDTVISADETYMASNPKTNHINENDQKKRRQMRSKVLMVFSDCNGAVFSEFLPEIPAVHKEYYFEAMRCLREATRSKRPEL